jgi:hypothetical protein
MSSAKKIEANRRNAQKSSGPKSADGKSRSRFNAVKHGMRATAAVLPGEDAAAFSARVDDWTSDLKPRNKVEQYLVDKAAKESWRLDRIELAHTARLSININTAMADAALGLKQPEGAGEDVDLLGSRLFWDLRGPLPLYPHRPSDAHLRKQFFSWSGDVDDPNNPARVVSSLEATARGCGWLLDRWAELRSILEHGEAWQSPDKVRAIRLLGRQPLDAFDDPRVGVVFLACHQIDPSGGELFHEIWKELDSHERKIARQRLAGRPLDALQPKSEADARQALLRVIEQAVGRLEGIARTYRERDEANAKLLPARLAFDDSMEAERLRRYETSCSRLLLRTLDAFEKRHRAAEEDDDDIDADVPASIDECAPLSALAFEVEPAFETEPAVAVESISELIPASAPIADRAVCPQPVPAATPDDPKLPNEPTARNSRRIKPRLPNEPEVPASPPDDPTYQDEMAAFIALRRKLGFFKPIETGTHFTDRRKQPKTGTNRRERRAQVARGRKTENDLTRLPRSQNRLSGKPPP